MRLKRIDYLMAAMIGLSVAAVSCNQIKPEPCATDMECLEQCPAGTRDLPADHPDHCDGGPQSASEYIYSPTLGRAVPVQACQKGA